MSNNVKDSFIDLIAYNRTVIDNYKEWAERLAGHALQEECERVARHLETWDEKWRRDFRQAYPDEDVELLVARHLGLKE